MNPTEQATSPPPGTMDAEAEKGWIREAHAQLSDLVGLRYHVLYHLFPGWAHHNLGQAHRRLMAHFGAHSPYAVANHSNYFVVVWDLLKSASKIRRKDSAIDAWRAEHQG
ncbi:MAG: hypothetical protein RI542_02515 [Wenzhouxiangella sp.]|nr:hypothetical protein [Wenzhouxiangella sp.]MDR9452793.1 hypothetical protein [Wenzhouxiangella sp.]